MGRCSKEVGEGRPFMRIGSLNLPLLILGICGLLVPTGVLKAQKGGVALTGVVSSPAGGAMEGVLVSAKPVGGTITTTVVSDKQGNYSFPARKLKPGAYKLSIRATGYDPSPPDLNVTVSQKSTSLDIKLKK